MKHWAKTAVFKGLQALPRRIGDSAYHFIQRIVASTSLQEEGESTREEFEKMQSILKELGITFRNKRVLEIGSGWLPILPFFLKYQGECEEVLTYDINEHFKKKRIGEFTDFFFSKYCSRERPPIVDVKYGLPSSIKYYPSTNIVENPPSGKSVDIVVSVNVLEHVRPDILKRIHCESDRYLADHGVFVHFVSPSDHRAYSDPSLSLYDFLRYSPEEWDSVQTRFDYHNRMRLPHYVQIFREAGLKVLYVHYGTPKDDQAQLEKFRRLRLHDQFKDLTFEELTAGSLVFVLRRQ